VLIAGLFGAIAVSAPAWATAVLGFAAIAATAELAIRPYGTNLIDKLLMGTGAVVTAFIIAGLAITLTPWGLTRITADVAWLVLSVAVLVWRRQLGTRITLPAGQFRSLGIWAALAGVILAGSVVLAATGVRHWDQKPVLAFALVSKQPNSVIVEIEATSVTGRYQIVATSTVNGAQPYSSPPLTVRAGGDGERLRERVPINIAGAWRIRLQSAADSSVVRYLIVTVS
jgi:hypothetical protein